MGRRTIGNRRTDSRDGGLDLTLTVHRASLAMLRRAHRHLGSARSDRGRRSRLLCRSTGVRLGGGLSGASDRGRRRSGGGVGSGVGGLRGVRRGVRRGARAAHLSVCCECEADERTSVASEATVGGWCLARECQTRGPGITGGRSERRVAMTKGNARQKPGQAK